MKEQLACTYCFCCGYCAMFAFKGIRCCSRMCLASMHAAVFSIPYSRRPKLFPGKAFPKSVMSVLHCSLPQSLMLSFWSNTMSNCEASSYLSIMSMFSAISCMLHSCCSMAFFSFLAVFASIQAVYSYRCSALNIVF